VENNATCITYLNLRHITGFRNYSHGNGLVGVIVRVNEFDDAYRIGGDNAGHQAVAGFAPAGPILGQMSGKGIKKALQRPSK
jgi:hypothetical protein